MPEDHFTICTECANFHNKHKGRATGTGSDSWFYHRCHAIERPTAKNPLNGKVVHYYVAPNGHTLWDVERFPYVRDINTDGNCQHWKALGVVKSAIRKLIGI